MTTLCLSTAVDTVLSLFAFTPTKVQILTQLLVQKYKS
jgi:hypothetical protein